jgi:MoaA/NifB/PqqE/SkfB family radical SAM enzyme
MLKAPWRITFDTNADDCNVQCVMCEDHSPHSSTQERRIAAGRPKRRMSIEVIRSVLAELKDCPPREIIPSTMGEPLLYKHFDDILTLCHQYGIKLNLTTNGTFPGRGVRAWAEKIIPIGSDVKISFNGATAETHEKIMLGSTHAETVDNIREFIRVRDDTAAAGGNYCSVTLQVTYLEDNVHELPDVVKLAAALNVDRVKGHHLWAHFVQIESLSMRRSTASIEKWNRIVAACQQASEQNRRPNGKAVRLDNLFPLQENATHDISPGGVCPFLGQEAWVNHAGRFDPCCAPDEQRKGLGAFGNVSDRGLLAIWNSAQYKSLVDHYMENELCQRCPLRRPPSP